MKTVSAKDRSAFLWLEGDLCLLSAGRTYRWKRFPLRKSAGLLAAAEASAGLLTATEASAALLAAAEALAGWLVAVVFTFCAAVFAACRFIVTFFREKILLISSEDKIPAAVLAYYCQIISGHMSYPAFALCAYNLVYLFNCNVSLFQRQ